MAVNQKLIVTALIVVPVVAAGTLGFDWVDVLFPPAEAHDVQAQPQSRFIRIEDETFSRQSMETGDILTVQGRLVSLVERDLRGWVSIFTKSPDDRWELVSSVPPGVFDIAGNSVVPYSVSVRALDGGVHHVHTQLNLATVGPGLGPGATVIVEGGPVEGEPIRPVLPPYMETAVIMPPDGAYDDLLLIIVAGVTLGGIAAAFAIKARSGA